MSEIEDYMIKVANWCYLYGMAQTDLANAKVFLNRNMKKATIYSINALNSDIQRLSQITF